MTGPAFVSAIMGNVRLPMVLAVAMGAMYAAFMIGLHFEQASAASDSMRQSITGLQAQVTEQAHGIQETRYVADSTLRILQILLVDHCRIYRTSILCR